VAGYAALPALNPRPCLSSIPPEPAGYSAQRAPLRSRGGATGLARAHRQPAHRAPCGSGKSWPSPEGSLPGLNYTTKCSTRTRPLRPTLPIRGKCRRHRTDRAIPAVLLVNELITNAAKYAYPGGHCRVWVTLSRKAEDTVISVRDEGMGLPATFDIKSGRRLGMRLVNSFSRQLNGDLQVLRKNPGTEFVLTMPLHPRS
jgi:hypothetical protein